MANNGNILLMCASPILERNIRHYLKENAFNVIQCHPETLRTALQMDDYMMLVTEVPPQDTETESVLERFPEVTVLHITGQRPLFPLPENRIILPPPFDLSEISRLLHRKAPETEQTLPLGGYELIPGKKCIRWKNMEIRLPQKEMELLLLLYRNRPDTVSKNVVATKLWPNEPEGKDNSIYTYINNLRNHLSKDPSIRLHSVYGKGFCLEAD